MVPILWIESSIFCLSRHHRAGQGKMRMDTLVVEVAQELGMRVHCVILQASSGSTPY